MAGSVAPTALPLIQSSDGSISITNAMIASWIITIGLVIFARAATKDIKLIPQGAQNFLEFCIEGIYNLVEGIMGEELTKKTLWFFATLFIFIAVTNWSGLLPITSLYADFGEHHHVALWRPATSDASMNLSMALIFMVLWTYWAIQANGFKGFIGHIFAPKGEFSGAFKIFMIVLFLGIGLIELVSIAFRPISLSLRLYGNIFGGENVMHAIYQVGFGIPIYFMELLVGFVQALVFTMLAAVFTAMICEHHEEEGHH